MSKISLPIEVSARHVHLSAEAWTTLFGEHPITSKALISQAPQFLAVERVALRGPKGTIDQVGVVGPTRPYTQVELAMTDARRLGVTPPLTDSGNLQGAAEMTIIGPQGELTAPVAIIQLRHIHANPADAEKYQLTHGQRVAVRIAGPRGGVLDQVIVRVHADFTWRLHLDTDEANAFGVDNATTGEVLLI